MKPNFYTFSAKVWLTQSLASWHFVNVPKKESTKITQLFSHIWRGWRSLPVEVLVGKTRWQTSIFLDAKTNMYLLPLKAKVRKNEGITADQTIICSIEILET